MSNSSNRLTHNSLSFIWVSDHDKSHDRSKNVTWCVAKKGIHASHDNTINSTTEITTGSKSESFRMRRWKSKYFPKNKFQGFKCLFLNSPCSIEHHSYFIFDSNLIVFVSQYNWADCKTTKCDLFGADWDMLHCNTRCNVKTDESAMQHNACWCWSMLAHCLHDACTMLAQCLSMLAQCLPSSSWSRIFIWTDYTATGKVVSM